MSVLCWGLQSWTEDSQGVSPEQMRRIPSLKLVATILLMQPRTWFAFWAASAHSRLMSSFSPTSTPRLPSRQGCSQSPHRPVCIDTGGWPDPGAGPCAWPCWTSWGSHRPTSRACPGPSGWHPVPQVSTVPLSLVSPANLPRVHSVLLSMLLMKVLNSTRPNTNPWGTPLVTDLHLDIEPLTTTLWLQPSSQFLMHRIVLSPTPCLSLGPQPSFLLCQQVWVHPLRLTPNPWGTPQARGSGIWGRLKCCSSVGTEDFVFRAVCNYDTDFSTQLHLIPLLRWYLKEGSEIPCNKVSVTG